MNDAEFRHRPIFGGVFGMGRYALATLPCVMRGLHAIRFMVIEPTSGSVISIADDKTGALDSARKTIIANELLALGQPDAETTPHQWALWPDDDASDRPVVDRGRPVSKRRRDIFSKCGGRCHYCTTPLVLSGLWHVEHMLPRALGGADEFSNLVAACVPCNLAKRDRTALEFVAERVSEGPRGRRR